MNPSFTARIAREQPLNIEADAELGMPLDLVGMPGIFDGDESGKHIWVAGFMLAFDADTMQPFKHPTRLPSRIQTTSHYSDRWRR